MPRVPRPMLALVVLGSALALLTGNGSTRASFAVAATTHSSMTIGTWPVAPSVIHAAQSLHTTAVVTGPTGAGDSRRVDNVTSPTPTSTPIANKHEGGGAETDAIVSPAADGTPAPTTVISSSPTPPSTAAACQPFALTYTGATQKDGNTTYSYTLIGGGPTASGCNDIAAVVLPVCFNPDLAEGGGSVVSESHPSTPAGWGYEAQSSESTPLATWTALGPFIGSGPFDAVFSLTLKGSVIPLTPTVATVRLVGWNTPIVAGTIVVPAPEGCAIASATAATPTPDPVRSGDGKGSFVAGSNATSNDAPPRRTPTAVPVGNATY